MSTLLFRGALDSFVNSGLPEDGIGQMARHDGNGHRERVSRDRAEPDFMAAFTLALPGTAVAQQHGAQLRVKPAAHASHGLQCGGTINITEPQSQRIGGNVQAVFQGHLRRNLPHPRHQRIKAGSLGCQAQPVAHANPHALFFMCDGDMKRVTTRSNRYSFHTGIVAHWCDFGYLPAFTTLARQAAFLDAMD